MSCNCNSRTEAKEKTKTTDNAKKNATVEVDSNCEVELNEDDLEKLNGGMVPNSFVRNRLRHLKKANPDEPKDGGATGSW